MKVMNLNLMKLKVSKVESPNVCLKISHKSEKEIGKAFLGTFLNFLLRPLMKSETKCDSVGLGSEEPNFQKKFKELLAASTECKEPEF